MLTPYISSVVLKYHLCITMAHHLSIKIVMEYFNKETENKKCNICEYYEQLDEEEQEMYYAEIKGKILRRKLENKNR